MATATEPEPEEPTSGPSAAPGSPPAYTAEAEPINEQQVLDKAHPRGVVEGIDEGYDEVVQITGTRCTVLESELKSRRQQAGASPVSVLENQLLISNSGTTRRDHVSAEGQGHWLRIPFSGYTLEVRILCGSRICR